MSIKDTTKKVVGTGAGVVLAAAGCSCGNDNGAVDPAPDPLVCSDVGQGETLAATGVVENTTTLKVTVTNSDYRGWWQEANVVNPVGVSLVSAQIPTQYGDKVEITLTLDSASTTAGSFTLQGKFTDSYDDTCDVVRTFTFTIGAQVQIAALGVNTMPLAGHQRTQIAMVRQNGREVELEARTGFNGPMQVAWTVSGGEVVAQSGCRVCWRLPNAKGFYQAQVILDCGPSGIAFDSMNLEVT